RYQAVSSGIKRYQAVSSGIKRYQAKNLNTYSFSTPAFSLLIYTLHLIFLNNLTEILAPALITSSSEAS
ncbi:hypothetical protein, partial [Shewanella livingstonensis]|uniref:hypothetical protein n=1 Tax=Shewanella livingstonensis TaxID=150120 RepID=UPI0039EE8E09